jgi:Zn-dependent peptidase ImmA (M78 family)
MIMPAALWAIAEEEGVIIEHWDFSPPLEGVYYVWPNMPPIIGISNQLSDCSAHYRCVLAEELGHHFTTADCHIPRTFFSYRDRLEISKIEYKALRWAALFLMPRQKIDRAINSGCVELWEFARYLNVTEKMFEFRMRLAYTRDSFYRDDGI